jgi:hypothetical protein
MQQIQREQAKQLIKNVSVLLLSFGFISLLITGFIANHRFGFIVGFPKLGMPKNYQECIRNLRSTFTAYMCGIVDWKETAKLHDVLAHKVFYNPSFSYPTNHSECIQAVRGRRYSIRQTIEEQLGMGDQCLIMVPYREGAEDTLGPCPATYEKVGQLGIMQCIKTFHK